MAGAGKSEVAAVFRAGDFTLIRFGDITDEEVKKRGLPLNEANERAVRESLREKYGMAAYADLSRARIESALDNADVVVDGLYSWEEYIYLKDLYHDDFLVVAVWASPRTRYNRLVSRKVRPLTPREAAARDRAEIEHLNKGGPIAMADFTIINDGTLSDLKRQVERIIIKIK